MIQCFLFGTTMFSHFTVIYGFGIGIGIGRVSHTYIRLIFRFRNIYDSVNCSLQLNKGLIPPLVFFKFEDILFLDGTFGISLSSFFFIMEDSILLMAFSHSYCTTVTYFNVKGSFILVELAYVPLSHVIRSRV